MQQRIVVIVKGILEQLPPVMTVAHALRKLDHDVVVVCSDCGKEAGAVLRRQGIEVSCLCLGPRRAGVTWAESGTGRRSTIEYGAVCGMSGEPRFCGSVRQTQPWRWGADC
ncbi:MAG: hypothetical protein HQ582_32515 [Planctomycetes bacterium]|nr:hypothetical protein [Planctomycetota bacterium]